jgi:hypothetical protein
MIVVKEMPKGWVAFMENDKSADAHPVGLTPTGVQRPETESRPV